MKQWEYKPKIEDMTDEELRQRIKEVMEYEIPKKIRPMPYLGKEDEVVEYMYEELIARCPMTGIHDLYRVTIRFIPEKKIPELKSLKFYFWEYQQLPISHEHLAAKIFRDFIKAIEPRKIWLKLEVAGRGEIFTTVRLGDDELENYKERVVKNL